MTSRISRSRGGFTLGAEFLELGEHLLNDFIHECLLGGFFSGGQFLPEVDAGAHPVERRPEDERTEDDLVLLGEAQ